MDLSLQNEEKHIHKEFTELHSLTPLPSELINVTTIYFLGYHSTEQKMFYVFQTVSTTRQLLTSVIVSKSETKINKCVKKFHVGTASV